MNGVPAVRCEDACGEVWREKEGRLMEVTKRWNGGRLRRESVIGTFEGMVRTLRVEVEEVEREVEEGEVEVLSLRGRSEELSEREDKLKEEFVKDVMDDIVAAVYSADGVMWEVSELSVEQLGSAIAYLCAGVGHVQDLVHAFSLLAIPELLAASSTDYSAANAALDDASQAGFVQAADAFARAVEGLGEVKMPLQRDVTNKKAQVEKRSSTYVAGKKMLVPFSAQDAVFTRELLQRVFVALVFRMGAGAESMGYAVMFAKGGTGVIPFDNARDAAAEHDDLQYNVVNIAEQCELMGGAFGREMAAGCFGRAAMVADGVAGDGNGGEKDRALPDGFGSLWKTEKAAGGERVRASVKRVAEIVAFADEEAEAARDEVELKEREVKGLKRRKEELTEKIEGEKYGEDGFGWIFENWCGKIEVNKYEYEMCGFGKSTQREVGAKGGGTSLGTFSSLGSEDGRLYMLWTGGQRCHGGVNRSLKMWVECGEGGGGAGGLDNMVVEVDEPGMCRYESVVESPVGCTEEWAERAGLELEEWTARSGGEGRGGEL